MTILLGDTSLMTSGPLKKTTIALAVPRETSLAPDTVILPQTEPAGGEPATVSYTVQESDLPTIVPTPYSVMYAVSFPVSGKNGSGALANVSFKVYQNGVAVPSGTGTHTNYNNNWFWSQTHFRWLDVQVGDVLEVRFWSPSVGVSLLYHGFAIVPTRIQVSESPLMQDVTYLLQPGPTFVGGGSGPIPFTQAYNIIPSKGSQSVQVSFTGPVTMPYASLANPSNGYTGKIAYGDANPGFAGNQNGTGYPFYYRNWIPTSITFREMTR